MCDQISKQIEKFLFVLIPKDGKHATKKTNWKGKINTIEDNVKKAIKDDKEEITKDMQERFYRMECMLQKTLEEHKQILEEYRGAIEENTKHNEEHRNEDQELLLSISERIKALEVETSKLALRVGHQTTQQT